ncbi:ANTAR domain-containing protein [Streptomyces sp. 2231.1]|uniref:ANTAR domain-containing protein n=1 Tax=Streptomyces sp. 2231.1 TaxID=1855347 RepID=UPI00089710A1|nr:ANTAR domain-containing protein [Streptomyces sp. 2231.1]SEE66899.1 ANTAR domain-containing protein [Streptomyces sp. 2231.1]
MTSQPRPHNGKHHPQVPSRDQQVEQLEKEIAQLRQAVDSHATIDQAIGVLICLHQLTPDDGFTILRVTSQLSNTKLRTVAEAVITCARTLKPLPGPVKEALDEVLRLHPRTH